jgi:ubiquinone/menaquinone biosynthesis C-methylase UbiE
VLYVVTLAGVLVAVLVAFLVWGTASRRYVLPCPAFLRWMVELDNPFTRTNRAAVIVEQLGLEPGMRVVDIGCGPGRLTLPLAEAVGPEGRVVAMDLQDGMLARVREKAGKAGLSRVEYLRAAAGEGALGNARFDCAVMVMVLGEIPNRAAALAEAFEALRPGGLLSVTEVIFDPHFQRQRTVLGLARAAGFRHLRTFGHPHAYTLHLGRPPIDQ